MHRIKKYPLTQATQYTFIRDLKIMEVDGLKTWVVMARYRKFSSCGEKDGIIRVDDFKQACVMQSDGKVGSKGMEEFKGACPHKFFG